MPLMKISEPKDDRPCISSEHFPPSMIALSPGMYEHTCPACGNKIIFRVTGIYCHA
jgi:predicted RNA-binding Zn-ribbon protein involved in translation (DUF1610 family)